MSFEGHGPVALVIEGRPRDLGGVGVRRVLPYMAHRMVGPFVFLDHMGPTRLVEGQGMDVRPHPHIALATVTYLFEGEIRHRDSLGFDQIIRPGDINWMTAGRGIVHSERTPPDVRARGSRLHGLQLWVALPESHEESEPAFHHHPASTLPERTEEDVKLRVLAGAAFGLASPVETLSPLFVVEATLPAGSELRVPDEYEERGAYVVDGAVSCGGERTLETHLLVLSDRADAVLRAEAPSRVVLLGGNSVGPRFLDWNFVSSSKARLERAKLDWKEGLFPKVPGDDEFVPLPEG